MQPTNYFDGPDHDGYPPAIRELQEEFSMQSVHEEPREEKLDPVEDCFRKRLSRKGGLDSVPPHYVEFQTDGNFTIALATIDGALYTGASKRNPDDPKKDILGKMVALQRAINAYLIKQGRMSPPKPQVHRRRRRRWW